MMKRHFLEPLGTGNYSPCQYQMPGKDGQTIETPFIQMAILQGLNYNHEEDRVTFFLTEEVKKMNWLDRPYEENDHDRQHKIGENKVGLRHLLSDKYPDTDWDSTIVTIPNGFSTEETWETFNAMYDAIDDGDQIVFDITHGFRSIQMLALTVLNYAKAIKKVELLGIYYGCFINKESIEPILDLTSFNDILNWSAAADSFVRYGNSRQIQELCKQEKQRNDPNNRNNENKNNKNLNNKSMKTVQIAMNALGVLTQDVETCRGADDRHKEKSIKAAYKKLEESFNNISQEGVAALPALKKLMSPIATKLSIFEQEDNVGTGMATVQWAIENQMTQQGLTALDETIKTYLCKQYGLDENIEKTREGVVKNAVNCIAMYEKDTDVENQDRSIYYQSIIMKNPVPQKYRQIFKKIILTIPDEFVIMIINISRCRNDVNHFGFLSDKRRSSMIYEKLVEFYQSFKKLVEKYNETPFVPTEAIEETLPEPVFVNCSNHPSKDWGDKQLAAAKAYGRIEDVPFPAVDAGAPGPEIGKMADEYFKKIWALRPQTVLCQGEFNLTFQLVQRLLNAGITVVSACSERNAQEDPMPDGTVRKQVTYAFEQFREYKGV